MAFNDKNLCHYTECSFAEMDTNFKQIFFKTTAKSPASRSTNRPVSPSGKVRIDNRAIRICSFFFYLYLQKILSLQIFNYCGHTEAAAAAGTKKTILAAVSNQASHGKHAHPGA